MNFIIIYGTEEILHAHSKCYIKIHKYSQTSMHFNHFFRGIQEGIPAIKYLSWLTPYTEYTICPKLKMSWGNNINNISLILNENVCMDSHQKQ